MRRLLVAAAVVLATAALAPNALAAAKLRVLHAAPDVPAVTVYVDGKVAVKSLKTLGSTGYLSLKAGSYDVAVSLAGKPASEAALTARITLKDGKRYTAVARGLLSAESAELALQPDLAAAPKGKAALRVWHLSPDAPNVDVYVNGKKTLANVPYEAASKYLVVPAGRYAIRVTAAGTDTAVFAGTVRLVAGKAYTAVALGAVEADGARFGVSVLTDASRT